MGENSIPSARKTHATNDIAHWLSLLRTPGIGPVRFLSLLKHFETPQNIYSAAATGNIPSGLVPPAVTKALATPDWVAIKPDLHWLEQDEHHIVTYHDPDYPSLLREIHDPPPLLFVQGNLSLLSSPQLAIVGSRNPSVTGAETAYDFASSLVTAGLTITSGMAMGIDAASHRGALAGHGMTIAVAGTGLDCIYPRRHEKLAREIMGQGAVISEFPTGTAPLAENFPRRNRIISGLSLGTLVVEAALRSGSLITARQALEQGREVFAIPGSIHNPLARGCHELLRQGAKLVENIDDIIEELKPLAALTDIPGTPSTPLDQERGQDVTKLDSRHQKVINSMGFDPAPIDILVERTDLTADVLCSILLELELKGIVTALPGGAYIRASERK